MKKFAGVVLGLAVLSAALANAAGSSGAMDPARVAADGLSAAKGTQGSINPTGAVTASEPILTGPAPSAGDGIDDGSGFDDIGDPDYSL